jgi:hypothetical protein
MNPALQIWIEHPTERARYAVQQVVGTMLGWPVRWVHHREELYVANGPCLVYAERPVPGAFHVRPCGLLDASGTGVQDPPVVMVEELPVLFPVQDADLPFDPFAAAFYQLARLEEYTTMDRDEHGRPRAEAFHAVRCGYVHRPVVDEWALHLADRWRAMDPRLPEPVRRYSAVRTVDLDNGFKYLGRPLWRTAGSMARDLLRHERPEVHRRLRVLARREADPFDVYADLERRWALLGRTVFFVLAADRGAQDHAVPITFRPYAERLRRLAGWAEVGIHPSYRSSERPALIQKERNALAQVLAGPVLLSRQHFLRFQLPETYRTLAAMGITQEHSMGFHEITGFRAGTSTPYPWYDAAADKVTTLWVHPFAAMDNTLRVKLGLSPHQAVAHCSALADRVRAVKGTFSAIWHESFLAFGAAEAPWREAILRINEEVAA